MGQAGDGDEAVRVATEVSPHVVVMDVVMPKKDGVEACREILEAAPDTRVLMLTAATEETAMVEASLPVPLGVSRKRRTGSACFRPCEACSRARKGAHGCCEEGVRGDGQRRGNGRRS